MSQIHVEGSGVAVTCFDDETILAALRRTGHSIRSGCRRGGCGICKATIAEGVVDYTHRVADTVLTDTERAEGVCLTCRAVPHGDVVMKLDESAMSKGNPLAALYASLNLPVPG